MALALGELFYHLNVRTDGINRAERRIRGFSNRSSRHFNRTRGAANRLRFAIASIIGAEALRRAVLYTDRYNVLVRRINTATKATGDFVYVNQRLFGISNAVGTELATNVGLFQSMARAAPELKATTDQALKLTTAVGQMGIIGGSTAIQMKNGILQFTQGLAQGVFRAEEMNSILENTPEIAARMAKGLGVSVGRLRRMVIDQQVSSKMVFDALLKQSSEIQKEFDDIPDTIERSYIAVKNSFAGWLGQLDKALGYTVTIAETFRTFAAWLQGDWSGTFAEILIKAKEIGNTFSMWKEKLQGDGAMAEYMSKVWGFAKSLSATLWDAFLKAPIYAEAFFEMSEYGFKRLQMFVERFGNRLKLIYLPFAIFLDKMNLKLDITGNYYTDEQRKALQDSIADRERQLALAREHREEINANHGVETLILKSNLALSLYKYDADKKAHTEWRENMAEKERWDARQNKLFEEAQKRFSRGYAVTPAGDEATAAELAAAEAAEKAAAKLREQLQKRLDALAKFSLNEEDLQNQKYREQLALMKQAEDMKLATIIPYHELRENLEQKHFDALQKIWDKAEKKKYDTGSFYALAGQKLRQEQTEEEFRGNESKFKKTLAMGAEHNKELFELNKGFLLAQALLDAPAAILSAYRFGSILGPIGGAVAAGIAAAATGAQLNAIQATRYGGGRASGGDVSAGNMYRVNEQGPEMLTSGGRDYLMMGGKGGSITPNNQLGGGNTNNVIHIHNAPGHKATVQETQTSDGTQVDIIIEKIDEKQAAGIANGGSELAETMERVYGLTRARGAGR